jgi:hypothetical protein
LECGDEGGQGGGQVAGGGQLGSAEGVGQAVLGQDDAVGHVGCPAFEGRRGGGVADAEQRFGAKLPGHFGSAEEPVEKGEGELVIGQCEADLAGGFGEDGKAGQAGELGDGLRQVGTERGQGADDDGARSGG